MRCNEARRRTHLQLRRRGLNRGHLAADVAVGLSGAFVDLVATGDEEFAEVFAAEADIADIETGICMKRIWFARRHGYNEVHPSCLIADLQPGGSREVNPAIRVHTQTPNARIIQFSGLLHLEEVQLRSLKMAIRLDSQGSNTRACLKTPWGVEIGRWWSMKIAHATLPIFPQNRASN